MDINKLIKDANEIYPELYNLLEKNKLLEGNLLLKGRVKSIDSYINRMKRLNNKIGEVDDLIGFCFIQKSIKSCYSMLKEIKKNKYINIYDIRDYIKSPCGENCYQAIHIKFEYKNFLGEIQIKTKKMSDKSDKYYSIYKLKNNS